MQVVEDAAPAALLGEAVEEGAHRLERREVRVVRRLGRCRSRSRISGAIRASCGASSPSSRRAVVSSTSSRKRRSSLREAASTRARRRPRGSAPRARARLEQRAWPSSSCASRVLPMPGWPVEHHDPRVPAGRLVVAATQLLELARAADEHAGARAAPEVLVEAAAARRRGRSPRGAAAPRRPRRGGRPGPWRAARTISSSSALGISAPRVEGGSGTTLMCCEITSARRSPLNGGAPVTSS